MPNSALNLMQLSQIALLAGIDQGFNAASVEHWIDLDKFEARLSFTFGDHVEMRMPRHHAADSWALSYEEGAPCIRERRTVELPKDVIYEPSYDIQRKLAESLLEVVEQ